jgi:hypothetical protein
MSLLTKFLLKEVLDNSKVVAIYGGGFKPPTKGHFAVVKKTLEDFPEIDELKIFVGSGVRDGITQNESIQIWNIYKSLLPNKIDVEPSVAPVKSVLNYAKDHPDEKVYWILGAREGDEDDLKDIENRTVSIGKYPNIEVKVITTVGGVSGTKTRQAIRDNNKEQFFYMIPDVSNEEKEQIWDMTSSVVKEEQLNEEINFNKIKDKLKNIIDAVKQESKETKQAFTLLIKSVKGDIELTDLQKQFIKEQMIDLLKSVGLVTLAVMPAGSLVALLLKALKLSSYVTPSAFINEIDNSYQQALSQTEKEALKITYKNWDTFGGKECNNGFCDIFARNLSKYLPGSKIMSTEDPRNETLGHVWVEYKGKHFDAETPNGVNSWKELPWMKEFYAKNNSYPSDIENLNEVGDASAKVYPFTSDIDPSKLVDIAKKFHETNTSTVYFDTKLVYKFKTDKANYDVRFHVVMERKSYANIARNPNWKPGPPYKTYASVGFNIEGDTEEKISNLNEQFSVLSTVTKIIFDFIDNVNASGGNLVSLQVAPKSDVDTGSKLDSKRGKFYAAYIKKNLSKLSDYDAKEGKNDKGDEYVEIYKKNSINEVGEANLKPYKWKEVDIEGYSVYIRFITDSETQYNVDVTTDTYQGIPILNIEFSAKLKDAEGSSSKIVVNKGEMYRVMATIVDIIKKYLKKSKTKGITYYPSKKSSEDFGTQRDNLYKAFISKAIPGVKFEPIRSELYGDGVVALLPGVVNEADPKKGTGKKPEGSSRRLYTDENPKDTVGIKFKTKEDIVDTLNKTSFKSKPHARQSQVINLIHQRVRAAYGKAKDPEVKARLKRGLDYIESRKEMSKKKTERLRKQKTNENQQTNPYTFDRLEYYKNYFINVSPSTFDITTNNEDIIISGLNKPYPKEFNDVEDTKQVPVISENMDSNNLEELVTATQVICDNCGWKWDKEDGGDDLYVCHKCGHDNTPISDPFGLNELAKQFGKEVGRDLTKGWNPQGDFVSLSKYMIDKGMNIKPLPKIKVIKDDKENASDLLGKTAYYDPSNKSITLYTFGRHPKDILRSFTHEMIHHEQNLNGKLSNITTTNTNEGGDLDEIEREAYEKGNMMLRNWEDSIKNPIKEYILDIPKFNYPKTFTHRLRESLNEITLSKDNAVKINGKLDGGEFTVGNITYVYSINNVRNPYKDKGNFYNVSFYPKGNITSEPLEGKENYIKILSTMYKIIVDFVEAYKPKYIGIASMDNTGDKNYHTIYAALTDNKYNRIPGYFRKDVSLPFNTPKYKGRFVVLKRKDV